MDVSLRFSPRIVAVDNEQDQLDAIHRGLIAAGAPSYPVLYDATMGVDIPESIDCSHARVVFLDLNLTDLPAPKASAVSGPVVDALRALGVSGPYLLVFWSTHPGLVDEVYGRIWPELAAELSEPLSYHLLNKHDFVISDGDEPSWNILELVKRLGTLLTGYPTLKALMAWEHEISSTAGSVVAKLNQVSQRIGEGDPSREVSLNRVVRSLGLAAMAGRVQEDPARSGDLGLLPLLNDHLETKGSDIKYRNIWKLVFAEDVAPAPIGEGATILNTYCHIDAAEHQDKTCRGTWFHIEQNDHTFWKSHFGCKKSDLYNRFIQREARSEVVQDSLLMGLLNMSAACDSAQRKKRPIPFGLGCLVPQEYENRLLQKKDLSPVIWAHEASGAPLIIRYGESNYFIRMFLEYGLYLLQSDALLEKPLFRVRGELLDYIARSYANHFIRPGITFIV